MRFILFPIAIALTAFFACNNGAPSNLATESAPAKDTIRIAEVDTFIEDLFRQLRSGLNPSSTPVEFQGEARELSYYDLPDGGQYWNLKVSPEGYESYATFFLKNGEPWMLRYREWDQAKTNTAREIMMYFKDGKIFFARERHTEPESGMNPSHLLQMPFADADSISMEELNELYDSYYEPMRKAWEGREK